MRSTPVLQRSADIVIQARQRPGLEERFSGRGGGDPGGEVLGHDCVAVAVDAETVVVSLLGQEGLDVVLGFLDYGGLGPDGLEVGVDGCRVCVFFGWDVGAVARDGWPAEGFGGLFGHGLADDTLGFADLTVEIDSENDL